MSSPHPTVAPGGTLSRPPPALLGGEPIDFGEPIDELPPLIEPVSWDPPRGQRPPRRKFLAGTTPPANGGAKLQPAPAEALEAPAFEIPPLIEPVAPEPPPAVAPAVPEPAPEPTPAPEPPPRPSIVSRVTERVKRARGLLPVGPRLRLAGAIAAGVALCLVVAAVTVIGMGPFARMRHYPTSAAPSDPAARLGYFQEGAKTGDANAQLELAILYAKGEGVKQDYATAATWFRAAADQGLARAQYDLGVLYERGRGVPLDLTQASNWYLKAAQGGQPLAQYNLAVCYTKGQGIRQDLPEAALWYRRAATQGVVQAMVNLAIMYEKGDGVAASPVDAYAWFLAAGRRDNQAAARHAEEMFAAMPKLDQIRAEALASDVAASIHDPERSDKPAAKAGGEH
ncbi:MAG TPA: tetratricopeptide repeat protein [Stellaceae bacterium]|nr:tetratricopeptide repeat protein [Stellaceae bacterium]